MLQLMSTCSLVTGNQMAFLSSSSSSNNSDDVEKMIDENLESSSRLNICSKDASHAKAVGTETVANGNKVNSTIAATGANSTNGDKTAENQNETDYEFTKSEDQTRCCSGIERERNGLRKYKVSVEHESVIISRLDGILDSTGERSSLYKCHLCGKLGTSLEKLRCHLVAHSRKLPFRCSVCDVRFQLRPQLSFHLKTQHGNFWHGKNFRTDDAGDDEPSEKRLLTQKVDDLVELENSCSNNSFSRASGEPPALSKSEKPFLEVARMDCLREPTIMVNACDENIMTPRPAVNSVDYSNGHSEYSTPVNSHKSYSNSLNVSSVEVVCKTSRDFASTSSTGILKDSAKNLDDPLLVDSSKVVDMTCRSRSQIEGHCQQQIGAEIALDRNHATRSVAVDLATKIRETEHLSDDVMVVIPSDVSINENEAKCENLRESEDSESTCQNRIIHAPHKSILGNSQLRTKRKLSASATTPTSQSADSVPKTVHASGPKHRGDDYAGHRVALVPGVSAGSLPLSVYNPLALSGFVQGFSDLVSSSLLSPIIAQTPLGFPGLLVNPLSLYAAQLSSSSIASLMNSKMAGVSVDSSLGCSPRDLAPSGDAETEAPADGGNQVKEELTGKGSGFCSSTSDGYASPNSKCSSLSRTHSRLNVIQKPIKRENAYKPIVMSDGRTAYHCMYCNKNFCTISDVNRHMDFHEDIRPYKCRFCNYYARTNSQLKVHMMRHQGIRHFLCRLCNYKGVTQSDLNRHTKSQIHMMKERNVCTLCREGFVSPMNLEQHRIEKHFKMENCNDNGLKYHLTMAGLVKENGSN